MLKSSSEPIAPCSRAKTRQRHRRTPQTSPPQPLSDKRVLFLSDLYRATHQVVLKLSLQGLCNSYNSPEPRVWEQPDVSPCNGSLYSLMNQLKLKLYRSFIFYHLYLILIVRSCRKTPCHWSLGLPTDQNIFINGCISDDRRGRRRRRRRRRRRARQSSS